jgi:transcriptional regulator with XRE-family HTH domain
MYTGPYRWPRQPKLKLAIFEDGRQSQEIAKEAGLSQVTVSGVCTGRIRATPNVRARLAAALGRPEQQLFDDADDEQLIVDRSPS